MGFERSVVEDAAILTAIGILAAFSVLLLIFAIVFVARWVSDKLASVAAERTESSVPPAAEDGSQSRGRALAAAIAVTALLATRPDSYGPDSEPG
ncbi:hypothetical protein M1N23_01205 [Dehalococcoidia bacterium]|nr:hypothetical protein [Dehalococcoidia bacterium]